MKSLIKQLLREGLTGKLDYKIEHIDSHSGQNDYELGVYLNDEILGLVQYTIYDGELTVSDIIVRPEYRRQGIGSKMMQYIKQQHPDVKYIPSMMTDLGAKFKHKHHDDLDNMTEEIERPDNETLIKEIEKLGYSATGRRYGVSDNAIRKWLK